MVGRMILGFPKGNEEPPGTEQGMPPYRQEDLPVEATGPLIWI